MAQEPSQLSEGPPWPGIVIAAEVFVKNAGLGA